MNFKESETVQLVLTNDNELHEFFRGTVVEGHGYFETATVRRQDGSEVAVHRSGVGTYTNKYGTSKPVEIERIDDPDFEPVEADSTPIENDRAVGAVPRDF